jgi:lipid-binding SYLF domain-containing protein
VDLRHGQRMKIFQTKTLLSGLILWSCVLTAFAADQKQLDERVRTLTAKFETMQQRTDKAIPADVLRKAQGIILLDRTKAGFIFGYQGGGGLAIVREAKNKTWGPVAFLGAGEASLGFQIGGEQDFYVILLMNTEALKILTDPNFQFGGEAQGSAGDSAGRAAGDVTAPEQSILIYDIHKGLYGGAVIKGGSLSPDVQANTLYYGEAVTVKDILFDHKVKPTETASALARQIESFAKAPDDSKKK